MSASGQRPSDAGTLLLFGAVLVYAAGYLSWYSTTPLGLYPVLDGREMLALAAQIAEGELPREPFYRAPLYPALLALAVKCGAAADLPLVARVLNGLFHLLSTWLVWDVARAVWRNHAGALLAGALFGLNPVVLHFAGDPLDITLAMTLMLGALRLAVASNSARDMTRRRGLTALAGLLLGIGTLNRPHLLTLAIAWPCVQFIRADRFTRRVLDALYAALPAALMLCLFGLVNHTLSGEFRLMPWQGAYNLWAANKPGAHGRYFEQVAPLRFYDERANAARLESERLYRVENPGVREPGHGRIASYWRARAVARIRSDPAGWTRQMFAKFYYLLNNFEQYNNKTYAVHKARSPWLAPNPIGWSMLLILGTLGATCGWRNPDVRLMAGWVAVYAAGLSLYYVSARFRLPLVPLLAIGAGFAGQCTTRVAARDIARTARLALPAVIVGSISLVPLPLLEREKTYVQDYLLLSRAASQIGQHQEALAFAHQARRYDGDNAAVIDMLCVTGFNTWLHGGAVNDPAETVRELSGYCAATAPFSDPAARLLGILYWRAGRRQDAVTLWREMLDRGSVEDHNVLAALLMSGALRVVDLTRIKAIPHRAMADTLLLALGLRGDAAAREALAERFPANEIERQLRSVQLLFGFPDGEIRAPVSEFGTGKGGP